jgi:hypothetical protein
MESVNIKLLTTLKTKIDGGGKGFCNHPKNFLGKLIESGEIEINESPAVALNGQPAVRLTEKGLAILGIATSQAKILDPEPVDPAEVLLVASVENDGSGEKASFEIGTVTEIPKRHSANRKNAKKRGSKYPFDTLVGPFTDEDSVTHYSYFKVFATEKMPKPARSMASVVSSENAKYKVPDPSGATVTNKKGEILPKMIGGSKIFALREIPDSADVLIIREV